MGGKELTGLTLETRAGAPWGEGEGGVGWHGGRPGGGHRGGRPGPTPCLPRCHGHGCDGRPRGCGAGSAVCVQDTCACGVGCGRGPPSVCGREGQQGGMLPSRASPIQGCSGLRHAESFLCALPKLEVRSEADGGTSCDA